MNTRRDGRRRAGLDAFERGHSERARAEIEQLAAGLRQRPLPTRFATEVVPEVGKMLAEYRAGEDRRMAAEQAGLPAKPFGEMNFYEVIFAMGSYDEPEDYPAELEERIQRFANIPLPKLSPSAQAALMEVVNLRQRIEGGEAAAWMVERLAELIHHRSPTVSVEAARVILDVGHPIVEEMRPTRSLKPKKARSRN